MYELADYLAMVGDEARTRAYLAAMDAVIRPGDHVLELGTGFGYFAVHACRLGAAHVYAIEPNDAVGLGRGLAEAHGCADRITFIQDYAERVTLPRRADVLVEDMRGTSALNGSRLAVLQDAAARLLVPDARRIPLADTLFLAPSEFPAAVPHLAHAAPATVHGLALDMVQRVARQSLLPHRAAPARLLAGGSAWFRIDFARLGDVHAAGSARWVVERDGLLGGLASWFAAELAPGIGFDTAPSADLSVYGGSFLPLAQAVAVRAGDAVDAQVRAFYDGGDYVWSWRVVITPFGGGSPVTHAMSNLAARALSTVRRARRAGDFAPPVSAAVLRSRALLEAVDGGRTIDDIAAALVARFASQFSDEAAARRWVAEELARLEEEPPT